MWLSELRIILPDRIIPRGALQIDDGLISEIVEGDAPEGAFAGVGLTAMPGIVDLHGDMLERDIEPRPGAQFPIELALYELDKRLAAAGVTTAFAAVSFAWTQGDLRSQDKAQEIIKTVNAKRDTLLVECLVHARFEITNPDTAPILKGLLEQGQVQLVSVMDHTPGQGQYTNVPKYVDFMTRWLGFDPAAIGDDILKRIEGAIISKSVVPRNWALIREIANVAMAHNIPVASHDDDTIEKVDALAEIGITISEFPVTLEGARQARRQGMHVIMGAPNAYRGSSNTGNLSARDAIRAGLVDSLATDYFPAAPFHAALRLAADGDLALHQSIKLVTQSPADAAHMHDRGRIAVGCNADLVLFEEGTCPRVRATLRRGVPIYWDSLMTRLAQKQHLPIKAADFGGI